MLIWDAICSPCCLVSSAHLGCYTLSKSKPLDAQQTPGQQESPIEEEKEKEKEREGKGAGGEESGSFVQYYGARSKTSSEKEIEEESQKAGAQEQKQEELFAQQQLNREQRQRIRGDGSPGGVVLPAVSLLTATMIMEAQKANLGIGLQEAERQGLRPIVTQYCRQHLSQNMSPPVAREALHWSAVVDMLLGGRAASALDVMTQRLKSLEGLSKSMRPDLLRQMELLPVDREGLASSAEVRMAGQAAHVETKTLYQATNRPWEEKGKSREKGVERQVEVIKGRLEAAAAAAAAAGEGRQEQRRQQEEEGWVKGDGSPREGVPPLLAEAPGQRVDGTETYDAGKTSGSWSAGNYEAGPIKDDGEAGVEFNRT